MSSRLANAQLRLLQTRPLPGLPTDGADRKNAKKNKRRRRGGSAAAGKNAARKRRRGAAGGSGDRKAPIALKVKESKARTQAIMAELEKEQDGRARAEKRTRRTLRALKTRKSAVAKNTLAALLARRQGRTTVFWG